MLPSLGKAWALESRFSLIFSIRIKQNIWNSNGRLGKKNVKGVYVLLQGKLTLAKNQAKTRRVVLSPCDFHKLMGSEL